MRFWSKFWKWLKLLNSFPFIKKTLINHLYIPIWLFWLTFTVLQWMKKNSKISPFIKKTLINHLYIQIWSFSLTFTILQWVKKNSKINQFSSFLLSSGYVILVKIRKWIKLLNSVLFIKKTLVNHVYIGIWSSWLTSTVLQWMKTNFKISQFSKFLLRSEHAIQVKIWKWLKFLKSVIFIKKTLVNQASFFQISQFEDFC